MSYLVNWFFELPKHGAMIAHVHEVSKTDRASKTETIVKRRPHFIGKQRQSIPGKFDNVWYLSMAGGGKATVYEVTTQGDQITVAGTRVGGVIDVTYRKANLAKAIDKLAKATKNG